MGGVLKVKVFNYEMSNEYARFHLFISILLPRPLGNQMLFLTVASFPVTRPGTARSQLLFV